MLNGGLRASDLARCQRRFVTLARAGLWEPGTRTRVHGQHEKSPTATQDEPAKVGSARLTRDPDNSRLAAVRACKGGGKVPRLHWRSSAGETGGPIGMCARLYLCPPLTLGHVYAQSSTVHGTAQEGRQGPSLAPASQHHHQKALPCIYGSYSHCCVPTAHHARPSVARPSDHPSTTMHVIRAIAPADPRPRSPDQRPLTRPATAHTTSDRHTATSDRMKHTRSPRHRKPSPMMERVALTERRSFTLIHA
jgi:hypothetical protein